MELRALYRRLLRLMYRAVELGTAKFPKAQFGMSCGFLLESSILCDFTKVQAIFCLSHLFFPRSIGMTVASPLQMLSESDEALGFKAIDLV